MGRTAARARRGLAGVWITTGLLVSVLVALVVPHGRAKEDRGDVPGWVMVTVMSAALVAALLVPFREAIVSATQAALANVTGLGGQ